MDAMRRVLLATFLVAVGLVGCGDSSQNDNADFPAIELESEPTGELAVARGESPEEAELVQLAVGEGTEREPEQRRALLTILEGKIAATETRPYSAELVRTVDTELYRDVDMGTEGPKAWITRAKVVGSGGEVLWRDRVNTFFQFVEFFKLALDQSSQFDFTVQQIKQFGRAEYPELFEFPVRVPLDIEGGEEYVLEVPDADGEYYEVGRFDIDELVARAEPPQFDGKVQTLSQSGPPSDRTDVVILGDGYTQQQKQQFLSDAEAVVDEFEETPPFDEYSELMNFHTVWTPSKELGAGYDCIRHELSSCNKFRDTTFRYTFMISALADQFGFDFPEASTRVALPLEIAKMFEVASLAAYDEVLLISNTDRRSGFAWMYSGALTAFDEERFPDVAVHEFGHSYGALGDEYYIETDPCWDNRPTVPLPANISGTADRADLKWSRWVAEGTELPTQSGGDDPLKPGAYKQAYNCGDLYRPADECKMRDSSHEFGPVCTEQLVRRMFSNVDIAQPGFPKVSRTSDGYRFQAGAQGVDAIVAEWRLDGETIGEEGMLDLTAEQVSSDSWQELTLKLHEDSGQVRKDDPRLEETHRWWVRGY